jgi:xylulokinase
VGPGRRPSLFDAPVLVPPGEYVADGAARQAAWLLSGDPEPPEWRQTVPPRTLEAPPTPHVHEAYAAARDFST